LRRKLLIAVAVVLALPLVLVVGMRAMRSKHEAPALVKGRLFRLRNLIVDMYAARAGDKVILFDAGIDNDGPALDALLGALDATRDDVSDVFLTHGHFDHVTASPLCKKARIHVGAADVEMLAGRARTEPFMPRLLAKILPPGPIEADAPYHGRDEITLPDGGKVVAIPLPGHTPGSYVLVYDGVLIAGDSLQISDGKLTFADPMFAVDMDANRANVRALQVSDIDTVCTGHQGCISGDMHLLKL
jgi:glyoxylase-like metal-dependent hydrolase (beta-lactamase superfamily II)